MLCFRYGFGEAGKPKFGIEANAELVYEVTLKSFEKVRIEFLSKHKHTHTFKNYWKLFCIESV